MCKQAGAIAPCLLFVYITLDKDYYSNGGKKTL